MQIPKTIHYCWFGKNKKSKLMLKCIDSWKRYCPDYKVIEWNEENYDLSKSPAVIQKWYQEKRWAFVSDYVRVEVVQTYGGIYLDTDMELIQSLDRFLADSCFFGYECKEFMSVGIFGAIRNHAFIAQIVDHYQNLDITAEIKTIPVIVTELYNELPKEEKTKITPYPPKFFYPFHGAGQFHPDCITSDTYGIHWWNGSWVPKKQKIKIYIKKTLSFLRLLKIAKKLKSKFKRNLS